MNQIRKFLKKRKSKVGGIFSLKEILEMQDIFEASKSSVMKHPMRPACVFRYDSDILDVQIPTDRWEEFEELYGVLQEAMQTKKDLMNQHQGYTDKDLMTVDNYYLLAKKIVVGYQELLVIAGLSSAIPRENITV